MGDLNLFIWFIMYKEINNRWLKYIMEIKCLILFDKGSMKLMTR
jgi:hypothetical protein